MSYFITPIDETDLKIPKDELVVALNTKWSTIQVTPISNPESNHLLEWKITLNARLLIGTLDKTRQVIHLDGDVRDCAEFAKWYRTQVPETYALLFYDEGFSADVALSMTMTDQEIAEPFLR